MMQLPQPQAAWIGGLMQGLQYASLYDQILSFARDGDLCATQNVSTRAQPAMPRVIPNIIDRSHDVQLHLLCASRIRA